MRLSKDLVGKPVVTLDDGRNVGEAKDIYLSADLGRLAGIFLGKEGIIRRKALLIAAEEVSVFGVDVILIKSAAALTDSKQHDSADSWVRLDKIQGREVDTPGGTKVGSIGDIVLDEEGKVSGYALSRVYVEGPIAEKRLIPTEAVIDNGNEDGIMTIDLNKAETDPVPTVVPTEKSPEDIES